VARNQRAAALKTEETKMNVVIENGKWAVKATWLGEVRTVATFINVFDAIRFVRANS
jgi:hypothetical protein